MPHYKSIRGEVRRFPGRGARLGADPIRKCGWARQNYLHVMIALPISATLRDTPAQISAASPRPAPLHRQQHHEDTSNPGHFLPPTVDTLSITQNGQDLVSATESSFEIRLGANSSCLRAGGKSHRILNWAKCKFDDEAANSATASQ